jgi:hypothetical protein
VDQFGPNALGEVLEPGRITDCYLALLLLASPNASSGASASSSKPIR